jgi:four helix bundle protein
METNHIQSYRDLIVWQKSMDLVLLVYKMTENYPRSEVYGLSSQSRRCPVSIPSNIAEGRFRGTRKDFRHFLTMAFASGAELETQLEVALRLKFVKENEDQEAVALLTEVMKMLNTMIRKLND